MQIQGLGNTTSTGTQGTGSTTGETDLQSTFLDLLIKQMQNQDPFSPMDNTQFIQQLATFSNLEQLQGINSKAAETLKLTQQLAGLTDTMNTNVMASVNTSMMGLVGKQVYVPGTTATLADDPASEAPLPTRLLVRSSESGQVHATLKDSQGVVVRDLGWVHIDEGLTDLKWDGRDNQGAFVPLGDYTMNVVTEQGTDVSAALFTPGVVEAVQFDTDFTRVRVNGKTYLPGQIVEVGLRVGG